MQWLESTLLPASRAEHPGARAESPVAVPERPQTAQADRPSTGGTVVPLRREVRVLTGTGHAAAGRKTRERVDARRAAAAG
ncbi:hypothetical protein AB0J52_26260 [Spirillospora sp. NPDC049652]